MLIGVLVVAAMSVAFTSTHTIDFDRAHATPENCVDEFIKAFQNDKASALQLVVPSAQETERWQYKWKKWQSWNITEYEIKEFTDGKYVTVWFQIQVGDETDGGTDQFTVRKLDDKWWIVSIPT